MKIKLSVLVLIIVVVILGIVVVVEYQKIAENRNEENLLQQNSVVNNEENLLQQNNMVNNQEENKETEFKNNNEQEPIIDTEAKEENSAELQVIQEDAAKEYEQTIVKKINIYADNNIELNEYNGNNIKVLKITDQFVEISREALKYEITDFTTQQYREYSENVVQEIKYEEKIPININEMKPFGPCYEAPRYYYYIKFVK